MVQFADNEGGVAEEKVRARINKVIEKLGERLMSADGKHISDGQIKHKAKSAKAQSVRTSQVNTAANEQEGSLDEEVDTINYKPHNQGGYAVSRKLQKINSKNTDPNHKIIAQQYLLDQIKNGWPYEERFYRTENVGMIRKEGHNSHPSVIVHFPNRA